MPAKPLPLGRRDPVVTLRVAELSMLRDLVDEAGGGRIVAVTGEPGAGKTELISTLVRERSEQARATLVYRCTADAVEPAIDTIRRLLHGAGRDRPQEAIPPQRQQPENVGLVVLEDAHLADAHTVSELGLIAAGAAQAPAHIVLTLRPRQTPLELSQAVTLGSAFGRTRQIELAPLTQEQMLTLGAASRYGVPDRELRNRSGGNPFMLCALQALDHNARGGDDAPLAPFLSAVLHEIRDLSAEELSVLHAAVVLRYRFDIDLVAAVAELDPATVAPAIRTLVQRDLLRSGGVGTVLSVRDEVFGALVHRTIDPYVADKAHRRAIRALSGHGLADREIGFHLANSLSRHQLGELERLVEAACEIMGSDGSEAIAWLSQVADEAPVDSEVGLRARIALSTALALSGRLAESRDLLFAVWTSPICADPIALAELTALVSVVEGVLSQDEQTIPLLNAQVDDARLREGELWPRLVLAQGFRRTMVGDTGGADLVEEALAPARAQHDDASTAGLLALLGLSAIAAGDLESGLIATTTAGEVLDRCPEPLLDRRLECIFLLGLADIYLGQYADARRHLSRGVGLSHRLQQTYLLPSMLVLLSEAERHLGLLKNARNSALLAVLDSGPDNTLRHSQALALRSLSEVWLQPVGSGRAKALARQALAKQSPTHTSVNGSGAIAVLALATSTWLDGDAHHCVTLLLNEGKGAGLTGIPLAQRAKTWELLCAAGLEAGLPVADWARRGEQLAREVPLVHHLAYALLTRGHMRRSEGCPGDAARCYLDAADRFMSVSMAVEQAYTLGLAASALFAAGRAADARDAAKLAVELARRLEAATLLHWLDQHVTGPTANAAPGTVRPTLLDELTRREREVAELICSGMKRKEIAEKLRISARTVDVHVTRIYRKTGVNSNTQLAVALSSDRLEG